MSRSVVDDWRQYLTSAPAGMRLDGSRVETSPDRRTAGDRRVVSLDGRVMASSIDSTVRLIDRASGSELCVIDQADAPVIGLSARADRVVTGDHFGVVQLWDGVTGAGLARSKVFDRQILGLAFSPDGVRVAACGLGGIAILAADTLEPLIRLEGHEEYVRAVEFSPDGTRLVSTSGDQTVRLWESRSATEGTAQAAARRDAWSEVRPNLEELVRRHASPAAALDALAEDATVTDMQRRAALELLIRRAVTAGDGEMAHAEPGGPEDG